MQNKCIEVPTIGWFLYRSKWWVFLIFLIFIFSWIYSADHWSERIKENKYLWIRFSGQLMHLRHTLSICPTDWFTLCTTSNSIVDSGSIQLQLWIITTIRIEFNSNKTIIGWFTADNLLWNIILKCFYLMWQKLWLNWTKMLGIFNICIDLFGMQ